MTCLLLALLLAQTAAQPPPAVPSPANQPPAGPTATNQSPGNTTPAAPTVVDPAAVTFATRVGLLLVAVAPDKVADYEAVIVALQEGFAKSTDEDVRTLASGWRVLKAAESDAKANVLYVHLLYPVVPGADYRPSLWLDKLLSGAPPDLLAKYRDAFAGAPSKLELVEFAHMAVAPVVKPQ